MRLRGLLVAAALAANLVVLVATSNEKDDGSYTTGSTEDSAVTVDTGPFMPPTVRVAEAGPADLVFDAATRTVAFDVETDIGQEILDSGAVTLYLDVTGEHELTADAELAVYDLADPADPLPEIPSATTLVPVAPPAGEGTVSVRLELTLTEAGSTVHHLVLALGGQEELEGELRLTMLALAEPAGGTFTIDIL